MQKQRAANKGADFFKLKANAYVDGLNLYHGALKGRPACKWLDLRSLCSRLLPAEFELDRLHYFTSRVSQADGDPGAPQRQDVYLRALRGENFPIHCELGRMQTRTRRLPSADSGELVPVRLTQEKGSDVNLAVRLVSEACDREMDAALVVTDDFDLAGALRVVSQECEIQVIVVSPRGRSELAESAGANVTKTVGESMLRECQLPNLAIDDEGREVHRPPSWKDPENAEAAPKDGLLSSSRSS